MELLRVIILFVAGFVGSFYGSAVGGTGLITFTTLTLLGFPIPVALATHRFSVLFLDISSTVAFYVQKRMFLKISFLFAAVLGIGAYFGARFLLVFPAEQLEYLVAIILTCAFVLMLFSSRIKKPVRGFKPWYLFIAIPVLFLLGIYCGFFGIAGGILIIFVPVFLGYSLLESISIMRFSGIAISLVASYVFYTADLINYTAAIPLVFGSVIGSWMGISYAIKKGDNYIRWLMGVVMVLSLIQLLFW